MSPTTPASPSITKIGTPIHLDGTLVPVGGFTQENLRKHPKLADATAPFIIPTSNSGYIVRQWKYFGGPFTEDEMRERHCPRVQADQECSSTKQEENNRKEGAQNARKQIEEDGHHKHKQPQNPREDENLSRENYANPLTLSASLEASPHRRAPFSLLYQNLYRWTHCGHDPQLNDSFAYLSQEERSALRHDYRVIRRQRAIEAQDIEAAIQSAVADEAKRCANRQESLKRLTSLRPRLKHYIEQINNAPEKFTEIVLAAQIVSQVLRPACEVLEDMEHTSGRITKEEKSDLEWALEDMEALYRKVVGYESLPYDLGALKEWIEKFAWLWKERDAIPRVSEESAVRDELAGVEDQASPSRNRTTHDDSQHTAGDAATFHL